MTQNWSAYFKPLSLEDFEGITGEREVKRVPVTQETIVSLIVNRNYDVPFDVDEVFCNMIGAMINKVAYKYSITIRGGKEAKDLFSECMVKIYQNLYKFDPSKSKFTTWSWSVAANYLCKIVKYQKVRSKTFADFNPEYEGEANADFNSLDPYEEAVKDDKDIYDHMEIITNKIAEENPEWNDVIENIFDYDGESFEFSKKVNLNKTAKETGRTYTDVKSFYQGVIRKRFKIYFKENGLGVA